MARPLRIEHLGGWYHVTARGNECRPVFRDDRDRRRLLELLAAMTERFAVEVCAYVLMDNHYHLLMRLREKHLSRALQWLNLSYTTWFNKRHDRCGHLFQGRFKSILFDPLASALELSRYVHLNPIRVRAMALGKNRRAAARFGAGEAPSPDQIRERLSRLRRHRWSSYAAYVGAAPCPPWLNASAVLEMNRGTQARRRETYRRYVEEAACEGTAQTNIWAELKENCVLGSARFLTEIRSHIKASDQEQRFAKRLQERRLSWNDITSVLEKTTGEPWTRLRDRHNDPHRDLALHLGRRRAFLKLNELAEACALKHYSAVGMAIRRYEDKLKKNPGEARRLNTVLQMLYVEM